MKDIEPVPSATIKALHSRFKCRPLLGVFDAPHAMQSLAYFYVGSLTFVGVKSTSGDTWIAEVSSLHNFTKDMHAALVRHHSGFTQRAFLQKKEIPNAKKADSVPSSIVHTDVGGADRGLRRKPVKKDKLAVQAPRLGGSHAGGARRVLRLRKSVLHRR